MHLKIFMIESSFFDFEAFHELPLRKLTGCSVDDPYTLPDATMAAAPTANPILDPSVKMRYNRQIKKTEVR